MIHGYFAGHALFTSKDYHTVQKHCILEMGFGCTLKQHNNSMAFDGIGEI